MANVAIIIVNWNGLRHLEVCLSAVLRQTYKDYEVILVDNGSTDGSLNYVKSNFSAVTLIACDKNHGFAEGNNIGIRQGFQDPQVRYIVCLNNDTEVRDDWLEKLVGVADSDEKIGACASKLLYFNERDKIDSAGDFYLQGSLKVIPRGHGKRDQYFKQEECLTCCAAAALYRRQALEEAVLGRDYFDTDYFAYIEDTDLSLRIRLARWKCVFVPQAVVYHKVSATTSQLAEGTKKFYSGRNRAITMIKIYPFSLWYKAIKSLANQTSPEGKQGAFGSLILYLKILHSITLLLPVQLKKRKMIAESNKLGSVVFSNWQARFSIDR